VTRSNQSPCNVTRLSPWRPKKVVAMVDVNRQIIGRSGFIQFYAQAYAGVTDD
jgi:hypothetical protein